MKHFAQRGLKLAAIAAAGSLILVGCGTNGDSGGDTDGGDAAVETTEMTMAGWGGAYSESTVEYLLAPFTEDTGIEVHMDDAPGLHVPGLQSQAELDDQIWDILDTMTADEAMLAYEEGLIAPLPDDVRAELESVLLPGAVNDFGFASASLGYVIVCNMDIVDKCPQNAAEFFDDENFPGTRSVGNEPRSSMTFAMMANGVAGSETATTPLDVDLAFETLAGIQDSITVFWDGGDMMEQVIQNEEAAIGFYYSGRAVNMRNSGLNLEIVWQDGVYNPGYFAVAENSPNKEAAFDLMVHMANNAEGLAAWAERMKYSVANPDALALIPADVAADLADTNVDKMGRINYEWLTANKGELDDRWREFVAG